MSDQNKSRRGCPRALIAGFALLLVGPGLLWPLARRLCDTTNYENRTLAAFPTLEAGVDGWPAAFEEWLGDHAPFRNHAIFHGHAPSRSHAHSSPKATPPIQWPRPLPAAPRRS